VVMVVPLRKVHADGKLYERRPEIEAALGTLVLLPRSEVADHCKVAGHGSTSHLPSECLLHLVRASRSDNSDAHFEALYRPSDCGFSPGFRGPRLAATPTARALCRRKTSRSSKG
jgi:hypothetical protein